LLNLAPVPLVDTLLPHATLVLLGVLAQYIYRDIWPLCTYTLSPKDATTPLLWTQIALCTFAGVVFPLLEPYPYVPFDGADPQNEVNPEQTAPLASHFFFSYVQHVIVSAHVNEGEKHPVLPPLADVDYTRNLVKASYPVCHFSSLVIIIIIHLLPVEREKEPKLTLGLMIGHRPILWRHSN
jgi:hypothetical protein